MSKNNNNLDHNLAGKRQSNNPQFQHLVEPIRSPNNPINQPQIQAQNNQIQMMQKQVPFQGPSQPLHIKNPSSLQLENQPSIDNVADTANNKSIEDLEMMLQMQEKINSDKSKSRDQYMMGLGSQSQGSQDQATPTKKTLKKNASQKTRVIPQSQQKMTKNSAQNMQPQKSGDRQQHYLNNRMLQAKTMQPKRPSSMNPAKSAQNIRAAEAPLGPQFFQTIGTPKNNNAFKISSGLNQHVQMPTSQSNSPQFDENIGAPQGVLQSHTMQVNRLQDHKNKKIAPNAQGLMPADGQYRPTDPNTANIVSQIMKNQQIQQNINIQQSNINKQQMKGKLNIKVVKNNADGSKPDPSKSQQLFYGMPGTNPAQVNQKATNPSVAGSDMQMQMQVNPAVAVEFSRQKSPSYVQTLTAYSNQSGAKPHKTSTKKNIKILSNSASLKKTLQNNSSNPTIMNAINMPGSQSEVQGISSTKKSQGPFAKKNSHAKAETRYQAVLAMEALNQEKNRGSLPHGSGIENVDDDGPGIFQSDYYRTTQNQKFAQTQPINLKSFNSVSPSRSKGNKAMNSAQKANINLLNQGQRNQNFGYNFGLQNKAKILQKTADNTKTYGNHLINSAGRAVRENSKDSIRKKPYATVSNKGKSMNKFGQGKNSVKPPTKKQGLIINSHAQSKQYLTQTNGQNIGSGNASPARMKVSRSSMGVGHQMQQSVMSHSSGSQISNTSASAMQVKDSIGPTQVSAQRDKQMGNIYTQLSDRVRRKAGPVVGQYNVQSTNGSSIKQLHRNSSMSQYTKKNNQQQLHYLPIQAKRGSLPQNNSNMGVGNNSSASGSRGNQHFSNASGSSNNKFASQERAVKMAEDNLNKIDEILAQNQKHNQSKKKTSSTLQQDQLQAMTNPQVQMKIHLSEKNSLVNQDQGVVNDRKSPLGYLTQLNQNTMINLNNNKHLNQNHTPGKQGRVKAKKGSIDKPMPQGVMMQVNNEKLSYTDEMQQFAVLQKMTTQSPIEIPSSSNTSKHSNKTFSQSLVSNTNQYAPEVKRIGQQFNEIVKGLQIIEQSQLDQKSGYDQQQKQVDLSEPSISEVISKLYSVKSSYDSLIKNMSKQVTQLQTQIQNPQQYQNMPMNMMTAERQTSQRIGTMSTSNINISGSQYNKVSYRKELTPHGAQVRDPPLSASSQSRSRIDAFGGTGGVSMNKCKYCKGMGQAPSSNSASERQTYAVASDRAVNTVENVPINSISKMNSFGNAADHITINLPVPKEQSIGSRESQRTKYEEMLEKKYNSDHKKGRTHSVSPNTPHNDRKNIDNASLLQQIRQLKEENKKMDSVQEQNKKCIKDLQEKDKQMFKAERQLAQSQSAVQKKSQELKDSYKRIRDLEAQLAQVKKQKNELALKMGQKSEKSQSKNRRTQQVQTDDALESYLSEKELDLLVELKQQDRKIKKIQKEKTYNANKISKFIYFFFTLQNKGIPVNEIYENDGVKFIQTDRFEEIMGQTAAGAKEGDIGAGKEGIADKKQSSGDEQTDQLSFYSDDSYEYVQNNLDIEVMSKFKNIHGVVIPPLDFEDLPEYETTDEEEEGDEEGSYVEANNPFEKTENGDMNRGQMPEQQLMSPAPHGRLHKLMDGSTGLKDGMQPSDAIRITNNDLGGTDPVHKFKPTASQSQTSSKKAMNKKDYKKSMQYIENFYQKSSQHALGSDSARQKKGRQDDSGMLFDDAPKSVTEESSMIGDEKHMASGVANKIQPPGTASIPNKLFKGDGPQGTAKKDHGYRDRMAQLMDNSIQQNFDQSEKFDESAGQINPDTVPGRKNRVGHGLGGGPNLQDPMEIMGITIDSQSFDQSIIDQSMTSELKRQRRNKKQKEDLDGSRLFREHGEEDPNNQSMISQGKPQKGGASRQKMGKMTHMMQGQPSDSAKGPGKRN